MLVVLITVTCGSYSVWKWFLGLSWSTAGEN